MLKRSRPAREAGSALILMPAAVMVVLILGAIAFDLTVVHLGERELLNAASAAANDAVTYGLDENVLRVDGRYVLDPVRVDRAVAQSLEARGLAGELQAVRITPLGVDGVEVTLSMRVSYVFAKALPAGPHETTVEATASATVERR